ncbi:Phosphatidylinositol 4-kinase gamma 4 [Rhynchospora pubera]|uniref:1-phosphatidylinositol 4-kinase n=1 Tax=Rhynchospora pubera TaxID=906938 RepID=A0AAV8HU69_9POAL|nr:Phosphatidylinositol 4-kinase gamma 4 [Rhynchospora pubera]
MQSLIDTYSTKGEEFSLSPFLFKSLKSPNCADELITIYLSIPGLEIMPMRILESDSIASIKLRIQNIKGFMVNKQKLVFDGRELAHNQSLVRDYGVVSGNILHLVVRILDIRFVTVKAVSGKEFKFHVDRGRTVGDVKKEIAKWDGSNVDISDHNLVFNDEELDDLSLIHDIGNIHNAMIHLFVQKSAKVRTQPVHKDLELSIVVPNVSVEPVIPNPKIKFSQPVKDLIESTLAGLEKGHVPLMSSEGTGGAYFMHGSSGQEFVSIFKPSDEEPMAVNNPRGLPISTNGEGLKSGTRVGEGAIREVAAYLLDHPLSGPRSSEDSDVIGFSGAPLTVLVRCLYGNCKEYKVGSLQKFVKNCGSCEEMGPGAFPAKEVHKICVLDIRIGNADRHAGNILLCKDGDKGQYKLVPIDHGYCLPENFEDCTFEWLYWPQARKQFDSETIQYINSLDAEQDISILKSYGWDLSTDCARTLRIGTMLLKKGAQKGLSPFQIGNIMCRETIKKVSKIEEIMHEASKMENFLPQKSESAFLRCVSTVMDRVLNEM